MKFNHYLDNILGRQIEMKALRHLVVYKETASVRELARAINISPSNVSRALQALEKENVLSARKIGTAVVYQLNSGHFLVEKIIKPLFRGEKDYLHEISGFIEKHLTYEFESIIIFGSVARGMEKSDSDIDALFIVSKKVDLKNIEDELLRLNAQMAKYFGNFLSFIMMSKKEFRTRYGKNDQLLKNISKDAVVISGKLISELL